MIPVSWDEILSRFAGIPELFINYILRLHVRPKYGRPKTTWLSLILNDISKYSNINLSGDQEKNLESLEKICDERKAWIKTVDCVMSSKKTKMQWWWWWLHVKRLIQAGRDPYFVQPVSRFAGTKFSNVIVSARLGGIKNWLKNIHRSTFQ